MIRKTLTWAFIAFAAYYLVTQPAGAAHSVHSAVNGLEHVATSLSAFMKNL